MFRNALFGLSLGMSAIFPTASVSETPLLDLFLSPGEAGTGGGSQNLTLYWAETFYTLLSLGCEVVACEPVVRDDAAAYIYGIGDLTFNIWDFFEASDDSAPFVVSINFVAVSVDRQGLAAFNDFPKEIRLEINELTLSRDAAKQVANAFMRDNVVGSRLLAGQLAGEALTAIARISHEDDVLQVQLTLRLRSQDAIIGTVDFAAHDDLLAYLVKDRLTEPDVADLDAVSRAAIVWSSLDWGSALAGGPTPKIEFELIEYTLLDKVYSPFVLDQGSSVEREFWQTMLGAAQTGPSRDLVAYGRNLLSFFGNWRDKGHSGRFVIRDPMGRDKLSLTAPEALTSKTSAACRLGSALWVLIPGSFAGFPYLLEKDVDLAGIGSLIPYTMDADFWTRSGEFDAYTDAARCETPLFEFLWDQGS